MYKRQQHGSLLKFDGRGEPGFGDGARGDLIVEVRVDGFGPAAPHTAPPVAPGSKTTNGCILATVLGCGAMFVMIPIVAAIMFPVFAKAREKARTVSCASNERVIALAMLQYSQDWDECLVPHTTNNSSWAELIEPYVATRHVYLCPATTTDTPPAYIYRAVPARGIKQSLLKEPATQVMGIDGNQQGIAWRHMDHANAWFLDGHVKLLGKDTAGSQYAGLDRLGKHVGGVDVAGPESGEPPPR